MPKLTSKVLMKTAGKRNGGTRRIQLDAIRTDAHTQSRARIDEMTVADYAEAMIRGDKFPPIVVFQNNGDLILADGFHRIRAAKLARFERIAAEVRMGNRLDALKFSLASNQQHGLRRTNDDKRHAVTIALKEFGNLSDGALGEICGVSQPFVSSLRRQLKTVLSSEKRVGRDGKRRRLPNTVSGDQPRLLTNGTRNGEEQPAHEITMAIAEKLADLEDTIKSALSRFPGKKPVILALVGKVKSDLSFLEKEIAATIK